MSIEVLEESGSETDAKRLARVSRFVLDQLRVHPQAELCIKLVDEQTIAELNEQWMDKIGPTDVLAFPMDELRPGLVNEEPEEGILGRSEEHTSELQSRLHLVCRLLLEKKKK